MFGLRWAQKTKPCFVTLKTFFSSTAGQGFENTKWPAVLLSTFRLTFLNRHMIIWFSWIISICGIYGEDRTAGHLVFSKPWPAVELKSVPNHGFVFWAQRKPNAMLEIYKAFQDRLTFLNRHMIVWFSCIFFDLWNLLKGQDCRSFSILEALTGYRPYSHVPLKLKKADLTFFPDVIPRFSVCENQIQRSWTLYLVVMLCHRNILNLFWSRNLSLF